MYDCHVMWLCSNVKRATHMLPWQYSITIRVYGTCELLSLTAS